MKIFRLAHFCLIIESQKTRILIDPLLLISGREAFRLDPCPKIARKALKQQKFSAILLSHSHPDHYSPETLKCLDKQIPIYIPKGDMRLLHQISLLGFKKIICLESFESVNIGGLSVTAIQGAGLIPELGFVFDNGVDSFWHTVDLELSHALIKRVLRSWKNLKAVSLGYRSFDFSMLAQAEQWPDVSPRVLQQYLGWAKLLGLAKILVLDQGWRAQRHPHIDKKIHALSPQEFLAKMGASLNAVILPAGASFLIGSQRGPKQFIFNFVSYIKKSRGRILPAVPMSKQKKLRVLGRLRRQLKAFIPSGPHRWTIRLEEKGKCLEEWHFSSKQNVISRLETDAVLDTMSGLRPLDILSMGGELRSSRFKGSHPLLNCLATKYGDCYKPNLKAAKRSSLARKN